MRAKLMLSVIFFGCLTVNIAMADSTINNWYLPLRLNSGNTMVNFEVDSTWHTIQGAVKEIVGTVKARDNSDPSKIDFELKLSVQMFDTDNSSRDGKLRRVMAADKYPYVVFTAKELLRHCTPAKVLEQGNCKDLVAGQLTIRETTKSIKIPVNISKQGEGFVVEGETKFNWLEFGVEDPSIFIAKVEPEISVFFNLSWDKNGNPVSKLGTS